MSLVNNGGKVDPKFNVIGMMREFGWTYQEYLQRPLWLDTYYAIMVKAEAKHQEVNAPKPQSNE